MKTVRIMMVAMAITACGTTTPTSASNSGTLAPVTITIGGFHQEFDSGLETCFTFSPNPATVLTNQPIIFYNSSTKALTIDYGRASFTVLGVPFKSLQPGASTSPFSFDTPGERDYRIDLCPNANGDSDISRILVTTP